MNISEDIMQALEAVVNDVGSATEFSRKIGVNRSTVERWLDGSSKSMNDVIWNERVYPAVRHYLAVEKNDSAPAPAPTGAPGFGRTFSQTDMKRLLDSLPLDIQFLMEKYNQLTLSQQKDLHRSMDDMLLNNRMDQYHRLGISESATAYGIGNFSLSVASSAPGAVDNLVRSLEPKIRILGRRAHSTRPDTRVFEIETALSLQSLESLVWKIAKENNCSVVKVSSLSK